jgi:hypothetical protein
VERKGRSVALPEELMLLGNSEEQRTAFRSGQLAEQWAERYPMLFDGLDLGLALRQRKLGYHFFEWLAAIAVYECLGMLSLVEQYEFKRHRRKREIIGEILPESVLNLVSKHKAQFGGAQCPDLFFYSPDRSGHNLAGEGRAGAKRHGKRDCHREPQRRSRPSVWVGSERLAIM